MSITTETVESLMAKRAKYNEYLDRTEIVIMNKMRNGEDPVGDIEYREVLKGRLYNIHKQLRKFV